MHQDVQTENNIIYFNFKNMERSEVYRCIDTERDYQDWKWNSVLKGIKYNVPDEEKSISEWINYIEYHINMCKISIYSLDKKNALDDVRKIATLAVRCLEVHGCSEREMVEENGN